MSNPGRQVKRQCPACGVAYKADPVRLKHGRETTCSRKCSYQWRAEQQRNGILVTCALPECGKQVTRTPKQIKAKHGASYCSRAHHYAGRSAGLTKRIVTNRYVIVAPRTTEMALKTWETRRRNGTDRHSDETRARLREATARHLAANPGRTVSGLEDEVAEMLTALKVGFRRQVAIRGDLGRYIGVVDFLLDDGRALEVNGTYWHTDPRVYPKGPTNGVQRRNQAAWNRKIAALTSLDVELVIVWEYDFRKEPTEAVLHALAGIA